MAANYYLRDPEVNLRLALPVGVATELGLALVVYDEIAPSLAKMLLADIPMASETSYGRSAS